LMKDQVNSLTQNGISAACINSSLDAGERQNIYKKIQNNELKLLYVSPEKLLSENFIDYLTTLNISFFAIDEAHCISSWGHDFRPEYTKLSAIKQKFPNKAIVALTATADKQTRFDICEQLHISEENTYLDSFDRPNLSLNVLAAKNRAKKIIEIVNKHPFESGIIYCLSRKSTETVAAKLQKEGFKAGYYHAGLSAEKRNQIQDDFSNDKLQIICATIAFGMGIDKSNIRFVMHYNLPKNMEGYYQEIGRAGRDGLDAATYLFYSYGDIVMLKQFALDSGQADIQLAKLESMQKYAEARTCRRKILLSYFNEILEENCNNCDVCANPPQTFDATLIAQKALSASKRMKEFVAAGTLINVLRGSNNQDVINNGYDKVKTFGAGKDISWFDWQNYILQMIHQGVFEIDFAKNQRLRITQFGENILFGKKKIALVKPQAFEATKEEPKKLATKEELTEGAELLEKLKIKRKELAIENNVPAFVIFSDKSLKDMVIKLPVTPQEFLNVNGVGENKLQVYGDVFISIILEFLAANKSLNYKKKTANKTIKKTAKKKGTKDSHLVSLKLFQVGKSIEQIAKEREMGSGTIVGHLVKCYEQGIEVDLYQFVSRVEVAQIIIAAKSLAEDAGLKDIFVKLEEKYSYEKIKAALALGNEK
ncbi:MAG: RecQ family ATP-dependent DNA helicase, partial [Chitinophagales bacterium]